jgi:glutamate 5-kinase
MATKLRAAEIASAAGISTVITSSSRPAVVREILEYYSDERMYDLASMMSDSFTINSGVSDDCRPVHTLFLPELSPSQSPSPKPFDFGVPLLSI